MKRAEHDANRLVFPKLPPPHRSPAVAGRIARYLKTLREDKEPNR